jgi:hypothetical protein
LQLTCHSLRGCSRTLASAYNSVIRGMLGWKFRSTSASQIQDNKSSD